MKQYPSISTRQVKDRPVWIFDKLDGSNIRAEWSKKKGRFYKFGSRSRLIDASEKPLGEAIGLIDQKYAEKLNVVFHDMGYDSAVCFFEFFGPNSFAGLHRDEQHDVVLFDIAPFKRGIIPPDEFLTHSTGLHTPALLHEGCLTDEIIESIRDGTLRGLSFEGVVCKSQDGEPFKIKTRAWLEKLKEKCGDDEALYRKLV